MEEMHENLANIIKHIYDYLYIYDIYENLTKMREIRNVN